MMVYLMMIDSPEDQSKFEKLYIEYRESMYQAAFSLLHNEYDAEDAVHQAFVKIAEIIDIVDGTLCARTKSFVILITERKAIDMLRYIQRHPTVSLDEIEIGITIEYDGPNALTRCMAQLPANYRQVLLLKHAHGFTSSETARILGLSEANVIKIDQRAKKKLLSLCQEEGLY